MSERYSFDDSDGSGRLFVILVIVAFALLAGWHLARDDAPTAVPQSLPLAAREAESEGASEAPAPTRAELRVQPVKVESKGQRHIGVYECTENGQRVVSDRPCGAGATARVLVVDPPRAPGPPVPTLRSSTPTYSTSARSSGGAASTAQRSSAGNEAACAAVDREIEALNARMRQGYGSEAGEVYRARWHALKERRYDLGCGR